MKIQKLVIVKQGPGCARETGRCVGTSLQSPKYQVNPAHKKINYLNANVWTELELKLFQ